MLVKPLHFTGNLSIGINADAYTPDVLTEAIAVWEPVFFDAVVGKVLYDELLTWFPDESPNPPLVIPDDIQRIYNSLLPTAVRFVYCHYLQDTRLIVTGMEVAVSENAVSRRVSPIHLQRERWNEIPDALACFFREMQEVDDPRWEPTYRKCIDLRLFSKTSWLGYWTRPQL